MYGCSTIDSTSVIVRQHLLLNYHDKDVCIGSSVMLPVSGANHLVWTPDATLVNAVSNPFSPTASPVSSPTVYYFKAKDDYGCFDSVPGHIKVTIRPLPTVSVVSPVTVFTGDSVQLQTTASFDVVTYAWTPNTYLGCDSCNMPFTTPRSNIAYKVTAFTEYGCASSADVTVTIVCSKAIYFPNAFTPDASSHRTFHPYGKGIKKVAHFQVFNRSGQLLYSVTDLPVGFGDYGLGWSGYVNGIEQPSGTYVFTAEAICDTGEPFPLSGTFVLIR